MISIKDITEMFEDFEYLATPCTICGKRPMFIYCDSCTTLSTIRLVHVCGSKTCGATIDKTIDLFQLSQVANQKFIIKNLLEEMVNEWNRSMQ